MFETRVDKLTLMSVTQFVSYYFQTVIIIHIVVRLVDTCGNCNRLNWGARDAWSSAPQLSLLQLSCTLLPSLTTGLPH